MTATVTALAHVTPLYERGGYTSYLQPHSLPVKSRTGCAVSSHRVNTGPRFCSETTSHHACQRETELIVHLEFLENIGAASVAPEGKIHVITYLTD